MSAALFLWFAVGTLAGAGHTVALWCAAHRLRHPGWGAPARLGIVGALLLAGGVGRHLLPVAAGWACGFFVMGLFVYARRIP